MSLIAGNQNPRDPEGFARAVIDLFHWVDDGANVVYDEAKVPGGADAVAKISGLIARCGREPANMINSDFDTDSADDRFTVKDDDDEHACDSCGMPAHKLMP